MSSPPGVSAEQSQTLYAGLSAGDAASLAAQVFHVDDTSGEALPLPSGAAVTGYLGSSLARLKTSGGKQLLAFSQTPWRAVDGSGELAPVSLALTSAGSQGGFTPANGPVAVSFPATAGGETSLPFGISVADGGAGGQAGSVVGDRVFYANTATDADFLLEPTMEGIDAQWQLRSAASPTTSDLVFSLPAGATLAMSASQPGAAEIDNDGQTLATIDPPLAIDASGASVPASYSVSGNTLAVHVALSSAVEYPVLVDPNFTLALTYNVWPGCSPSLPYSDFGATYGGGSGGDNISAYATTGATSGQYGNVGCVAQQYVSGNVWLYSAASTGINHSVQGTNSSSSTFGIAGGNEWTTNTAFSNNSYTAYDGSSTGPAITQVQMNTTENSPGKNDRTWLTNLTLTFQDPNGPSLTGWPNYNGEWLTGSQSLGFTSTDNGMGVTAINLEIGGTVVDNDNFSCEPTGSSEECPQTESLSYSVGNNAGQANIYAAQANTTNPFNETSYSQTFGVDNTTPSTPSLSGSLYTAATVGGTPTITNGPYTLNATSSDGTPSAPASGVAYIKMTLDGNLVASSGNACGAEINPLNPSSNAACYSASTSYTVNGENLGEGQHTITVQSENYLGARSQVQTFTFDVHPAAETAIGPGSVNLSSGEFSLDSTDVSIPGFGTTLSVSRDYNSRTGPAAGPLGPGWGLSVPAGQAGGDFTSASTDAAGDVTLTDDSGNKYTFTKSGSNYLPPPDLGDLTLTAGSGGAAATSETPTSPGGGPFGIADGPNGNLWFTDNSSGKVGWFTPGSTGTYADASGNGYTAKATGYVASGAPGPIVADPSHSLGATFNGSSCLGLGSAALGDTTGDPGFTVEAWIEPISTSGGSSAYQDIYRKAGSGGFLRLAGNQLQVYVGNGSSELSPGPSTGTVPGGQWTQVAATYNASSGAVSYYINGQSAGGGTIATGQLGSTPDVPSIGAAGTATGSCSGEYFQGGLADVAIYGQALTQSQIGTDYTATSQTGYASSVEGHGNLQGFYQLNDAAASSEYWLPGGSSPAGITEGTDGNLWVPEIGTNMIAKVSPSASNSYTDASGNDRPGSAQGYVANAQGGPFSGAFSAGFSGSSSVTSSLTPVKSTSNWTLAAWIDPASSSEQGMVVYDGDEAGLTGSSAGGSNGYGFGVFGSSGGSGDCLVGLYEAVAWENTSYCSFAPNTWYYVVETSSGGTVNFYVDGSQLSTSQWQPTNPGTPLTPSGMMIGGYNGNNYGGTTERYFNGSISNVSLYSSALTAAQISGQWSAGSSQSSEASTVLSDSPAAYYELNQPSYVTQYGGLRSNAQPYDIAAGPDGNLWFTEAGASYIGEMSASGTLLGQYALPSGSEPTGITAGPDGAMWFTEQGTSEIGRITTALASQPTQSGGGPPPVGTFTQYPTPTPSSQPFGITLGSDGELWFSEYASNQIGELNPAVVTADNTYYDSTGDGNGLAANGSVFNTPQGPMTGASAVNFVSADQGSIASATKTPITTAQNWSLEAWINPSSASQHGMVLFNGDQGGLSGSGNGFGFGIGGASSFEAGGDCLDGLYEDVAWINTGYCGFVQGQWYHVVETNSGGAVSFYVNGQLVWSGNPGTPISPVGVTIGGYNGANYGGTTTRYFNGSIADAAFYNSAISSAQVQTDYNTASDNGTWQYDSQSTYASQILYPSQTGYVAPVAFYQLNEATDINEYSIANLGGGSSTGPEGIVAGPDGALWFDEAAANKIGRIPTGGGPISTYATNGAPQRIVTGSDGNVYFTDNGASEIGEALLGASSYTLTDSEGDSTIFSPQTSTGQIVPVKFTQPGGLNQNSVAYETVAGSAEPAYVIAAAQGISQASCINHPVAGCRMLHLIYAASNGATTTACPSPNPSSEYDYAGQLAEVDFTAWNPASSSISTTAVGCYLYDSSGELVAQWDPRTDTTQTAAYPATPATGSGLQTTYAYKSEPNLPGPGKLLTAMTPPGENAWTFSYGSSPYGDHNPGSLASVSRTLNGVASTQTIGYGVATTGVNAPYSFASANNWAESTTSNAQNTPSIGTAIFPPSDSSPGTSTNNQATIYYLDPVGDEVNVASPPTQVLAYNQNLNSGAKPSGAASGPDGNVWFTDQGTTPAVGKITPSGTISEYSSGLGSGSVPNQITSGPDGNLWFTDKGTTPAIGKTTTSGTITEYTTGLASGSKPAGITAGPDGNLWFADPGAGKLGKATTSDAITEYSTGLSAGSTPTGIAAGPDGNLWFTDPGAGEVGDINPTTDAISEYSAGLGSGTKPTSIVAGPGGLLWFTDDGTTPAIGTINPTTHAITEYSTGLPSGSIPAGITLGSDGNVWFIDKGANEVGKITPSGTITEYLIPTGSSGAIATGADGALWFPETTSPGQIGRITTAGDTSQGWISTTQYDQYYNVLTTLTPNDRLEALANSNPSTEAGLLETQNTYNSTVTDGAPVGTELDQTLGPQHSIVLAAADGSDPAGSTVQARDQVNYTYDQNAPAGGPYYLATTRTDGADVSGQTAEGDLRTTTTSYSGQNGLGWTLRAPTSITVDPSGLDLTSTTFYDPTTAQPIETVQPEDSSPNGPNSSGVSTDSSASQTYYYASGASASVPSYCQSQPALAGLVCKTQPATQPSDAASNGHSAADPSLPVTGGAVSGGAITAGVSYNMWDQPLTSEQLAWNTSGNQATRTTTDVYDPAGRILTSSITASGTGTGTSLPTVYDTYYSSTGLPASQINGNGTNPPTISATYDGYGRLATYTDSSGNTATYGYDVDGRLSTLKDTGDSTEGQTQNGGQTSYSYDPYSGTLTSITDPSGISFYGTYDADGNLLSQTFPNGMTASTAYNEEDAPTSLAYLKLTACTTSCTWYSDTVADSIHDQVLRQTDTLAGYAYTYDTDGRLTQAEQTPAGGDCTTRQYAFNPDSDRASLTTIGSSSSTCATTGGTTQNYSYDSADRLTDSGVAYDPFGRLTTAPAGDAGGNALTSQFYVDDKAQQLQQNGQTNVYTLDPSERLSERTETGNTALTQLTFYDNASDDPSWTENLNSQGQPNGTWTRNITGIDGNLDAIQTNTSTQLQLSNLQGSVVGTAPTSQTGTATLDTCEPTEYGVPCPGGNTSRYSWLGGKEKATELPSGIVAMGARVYDPDTGTFLQTDPIRGGDANSYGYANGDPVNETDLSGAQAGIPRCMWYGHTCGGPSLGDVVQVLTFATAPLALVDPFEDAGLAAEDAGSEGFSSFSAAKRAMGSPGDGNVYDHVVEQSQIGRSGFSPEEIHNPHNLNPVSARVNQLKANYYSSKQDFTGAGTVRDWLTGKSFGDQYRFGMETTERIQRG